MEFAKYYNVTAKLDSMINKKQVSSYKENEYRGVFICNDVHDMWIYRILEGYNEDYEKEDGKYLLERNKIDKYDLCDFLKEESGDIAQTVNRTLRDLYIEELLTVDEIIEAIILMDDEAGLENWDCIEHDDYDECIALIDGGYGIIDFIEQQID